MMKNKYILITGAGSGLGRALVHHFASAGYPVVLVGRSKEKLSGVQQELHTNTQSLVLSGDVGVKEDVDRIFDEANFWKTGPGMVISCAGTGVFGPVGNFSQQDFERALSGSLCGTVFVSQRAFAEMKEEGGTIVNVMSTASTVARANESLYCAAKWGARGFTESLRLEAKGSPVEVIAVYPGGMKTPFWSEDCGASPDTSNFMEPDEVAGVIFDSVLNKKSLFVSDLIINRRG